MATMYAAARESVGLRLVRALAAKWDAWRSSRLEQRLAPAESHFFNAYGRGGTHPGRDLVIDFTFTTRPQVREVLRRTVLGRPPNRETLEKEYRAWEPNPDFARFRANAEHLVGLLRNA